MTFEERVREFFSIDKRLYFLFLCFATFLILFIKKTFVEAETAAFVVMEARGQMGIFNLINALQYLSIPVWYAWKFTIIAFLLWLGSFAFGYKLSFTKSWQIVMIAETIFLIPETLKILHFTLGSADPTLWDIQAYYPLSLINLVDYEMVDKRWHYPLKALNVFEPIYWVIMTYGVHLAMKKRSDVAAAIVFFGYVLIFFLWLWYYSSVYK